MQDNIQAIIQNRLLNPGQFEKSVVEYLRAAGCEIDQSKTVAAGTFTDIRDIAGLSTATFFNSNGTTQFNQSLTTVPNSYNLNDGEHKLIYGMKIYDGTDVDPLNTDWAPGANAAEVKNGRISMSNNGVNVMAPTLMTTFQEGLTDQEVGMFFFKPWVVWAGQTLIQVPVVFPVVPVADTNMLVELYWVGLIS